MSDLPSICRIPSARGPLPATWALPIRCPFGSADHLRATRLISRPLLRIWARWRPSVPENTGSETVASALPPSSIRRPKYRDEKQDEESTAKDRPHLHVGKSDENDMNLCYSIVLSLPWFRTPAPVIFDSFDTRSRALKYGGRARGTMAASHVAKEVASFQHFVRAAAGGFCPWGVGGSWSLCYAV